MSLSVIVTFKVEPSKFPAFTEFLKRSLQETRSFEGSLGLSVAVQSSEAVVILHELWRSKEDQLAYRAWRAARGDSAIYMSYQREAPTFTDYETLLIPA